MKRKLFLIFAVSLIAFMATTPALAFDGVSGLIIDEKNGDPWAWEATVYAWNSIDYTVYINGTSFTGGSFAIDWDTIPPLGAEIEVFIVYGDPPGTYPAPTPASIFIRQLPPSGHYPLGNISTGTGPNAIELVDFSVTPQSSGNIWLPFVLLAGSVALVSGAVAVVRKRKA